MDIPIAESWVVYRPVNKGVASDSKAVCTHAEWAALELARPGGTVVVRAGIASEGEAERLARGTAGDPVPKPTRTRET